MMNRKLVTSVLVLGASALLIAQGVVRFEARMRNGIMEGKAKYKLSTRAGRQVQEELEFEGSNLAPNTEYTLTVNGFPAGTTTTNGFGAFQWAKRTVGQTRFTVSNGTPVTIENGNGVALAGALAPR